MRPPQITKQVCVLSRLKAAQLFWQEIDELRRDPVDGENAPNRSVHGSGQDAH